MKSAVVKGTIETRSVSSPPLLSQGFFTWGIYEQHSPTPLNVLMMNQITSLPQSKWGKQWVYLAYSEPGCRLLAGTCDTENSYTGKFSSSIDDSSPIAA